MLVNHPPSVGTEELSKLLSRNLITITSPRVSFQQGLPQQLNPWSLYLCEVCTSLLMMTMLFAGLTLTSTTCVGICINIQYAGCCFDECEEMEEETDCRAATTACRIFYKAHTKEGREYCANQCRFSRQFSPSFNGKIHP